MVFIYIYLDNHPSNEPLRFPVLLAIDDFQALYTHHSAYRDPHFNKIKPHHLSMPRLLLEYASGMKSFGNGVVLGAVTMTDPSYPVPIELREQLNIPHAQATSAYEKKTKESIEYARGLKAIPVPEQLSLDEASGLFDLWMKDRALSASKSPVHLTLSPLFDSLDAQMQRTSYFYPSTRNPVGMREISFGKAYYQP